MTWQSSYNGGDPRMSPPHGLAGTGPGQEGRAPSPQATGSHPRPGHPHFRHYSHPPVPHHHAYGGPQPVHPPPPPPARPYDRYYDYSGYPPPSQASHQYGPPRHYSESSSEQKAASSGRDAFSTIDSFRTGGCTCKKSRCLKLYCQCFALSTTCGPKCKCQTCFNTTLHAESIEDARKTILERNPSAFDDKFRGGAFTPSPFRGPPPSVPMYHQASPPTTVWPTSVYRTPSAPPAPLAASPPGSTLPPPRVNKFGCKCRRSFCLKKYCECYQNSVKCGLNCRCTNCRNYPHEGRGLPPPRPPPPIVPVSYGPTSPRCVSDDTVPTAVPSVTPAPAEPANRSDAEDRMAIMAAVAMTELFGSKKEIRDEPSGSTCDEQPNKKNETSAFMQAPVCTPENKRKVDSSVVVSSPDKSDDEESSPPQKRARSHESIESEISSPRHPEQPESRNPSPVSIMTPQTSYPRHFIHRPPPHHTPSHRPHHRLQYHLPPAHQHGHCDLRHGYLGYHPSPPQPRASSYEDVIKSSGLPKALSFRKICSKCGKTRGEHGELGFGNKCVFQDCGKCGAGVQMHTKAGSPMGILCRLTVQEGATPGAANTYERKIRDLAARAELQKTLLEDKRERVERLAAQTPFVSTA